ncbi:hypothetical protein CPB83DRAFT_840966 [Crepidotus variabilis]|uniref:Uncharacterized protein n=1 Tax=Crepidotus variabilis TaxID=179855 RepID=A0A9P6JI66_9AGAR|nr:hypothetical protein CPB83DRAFT_840966 [Crepidotus variabilis]
MASGTCNNTPATSDMEDSIRPLGLPRLKLQVRHGERGLSFGDRKTGSIIGHRYIHTIQHLRGSAHVCLCDKYVGLPFSGSCSVSVFMAPTTNSVSHDILLEILSYLVDDDDITIQHSAFLAAPSLRRHLQRSPTSVHIDSGSTLQRLYTDARNFIDLFPGCSFAHIVLIQTGIPQDDGLKTMLRDLFKMLPTIVELNVTFDAKTDCSKSVFMTMQTWPSALPGLSKLRIKFRPSLDSLPDKHSPWQPDMGWRKCIVRFKTLEVVQIVTPLMVTSHQKLLQLEWVVRWADRLPNLRRVYLCHSTNDLKQYSWNTSTRNVYLKKDDGDWRIRRWRTAGEGLDPKSRSTYIEDEDYFDSEDSVHSSDSEPYNAEFESHSEDEGSEDSEELG